MMRERSRGSPSTFRSYAGAATSVNHIRGVAFAANPPGRRPFLRGLAAFRPQPASGQWSSVRRWAFGATAEIPVNAAALRSRRLTPHKTVLRHNHRICGHQRSERCLDLRLWFLVPETRGSPNERGPWLTDAWDPAARCGLRSGRLRRRPTLVQRTLPHASSRSHSLPALGLPRRFNASVIFICNVHEDGHSGTNSPQHRCQALANKSLTSHTP